MTLLQSVTYNVYNFRYNDFIVVRNNTTLIYLFLRFAKLYIFSVLKINL